MVLNTRPSEIHAALTAIGVPVQEVYADDTVVCVPGYEQQISLVIAATGKPPNSPEVQALKAYLGATSPEWLALVDARKEPMRERRIALIAGKLLLDMVEMWATGPVTETPAGSGYYAVRVKKTDWDAWRQKLAAIAAQYPYLGD